MLSENFHSESDPTKTGEAFPVIRFANNTNDILVYMQFVGEDKKLKESGSEQVKSFESKEKLQQWLDKYKVEFAADSPEQLQAAIDANQSKI